MVSLRFAPFLALAALAAANTPCKVDTDCGRIENGVRKCGADSKFINNDDSQDNIVHDATLIWGEPHCSAKESVCYCHLTPTGITQFCREIMSRFGASDINVVEGCILNQTPDSYQYNCEILCNNKDGENGTANACDKLEPAGLVPITDGTPQKFFLGTPECPGYPPQ